jgi:hypothetical protein
MVFAERLRVRSCADFVQSLILGWLQEPEIALDGLTQVLERREVSISASGLSQRFTPEEEILFPPLVPWKRRPNCTSG